LKGNALFGKAGLEGGQKEVIDSFF